MAPSDFSPEGIAAWAIGLLILSVLANVAQYRQRIDANAGTGAKLIDEIAKMREQHHQDLAAIRSEINASRLAIRSELQPTIDKMTDRQQDNRDRIGRIEVRLLGIENRVPVIESTATDALRAAQTLLDHERQRDNRA